MSEFCRKKIFFAAVLLLIFSPVFFAEAALSAPVLSSAISNCSGSDPYVTLSWTAVSGATGYDIFRETTIGPPIASVGGAVLNYDDLGVLPKENHTYYVKATNSTETSPASNPFTLAIAHCGSVIILQGASCTSSGPKIDLAWNDLPDAPAFQVIRDGFLISTLPAHTLNYSDLTPIGSRSYLYKVRADWGGGDTKDSNELINTLAPACPVTLSGNPDCNAPGAEANLSWQSITGVDSYQIFKNGSFLDSTTNHTYTDTTVNQRTLYSYFIRAVYPLDSADSNTIPSDIPRCAPVLTAQAVCDSTNPTIPNVLLSWKSTIDSVLYNIYDITGAQTIIGQNNVAPLQTTYTDNRGILTNGNTYTYQVNAQGVGFDLASNSAVAQPNCTIPTPSPDPVLTANPICTSGDSRVSLSWTPSNNVFQYVIHRVNNNTGQPADIPILRFNTSYTDSGVEANVPYTYTIIAQGNGGSASSIPQQIITATLAACTKPSDPVLSPPSAVCSLTGPVVSLSWTQSTATNKYQIYRNGSLLTEINNPNVTTYDDSAVSSSVSYTYQIFAIGLGGTGYSLPNPAFTTPDCNPPSAPTIFSGTPVCSGSNVNIPLSWTSSTNASYYDIYRQKLGDAGFSYLTNTTQLSYMDSVLQNTTYNYYVMAVGAGGSKPSNQETKTTPNCPPSQVTVSVAPICALGLTSLQVNWTDPTPPNTSSYEIGRDGGVISTVPAPASSFTDNNGGAGLVIGENHSYTVKTIGPAGSAISNPASGTGISCSAPGQPIANLAGACNVSNPTITISWQAVSNTTSYSIYRDSVLIASGITGLSYIDGGVMINQTYSYIVRAIGPGGTTDSVPVSLTPAPCPPPVLEINLNPICLANSPAVNLSWGENLFSGIAGSYHFNEGSGTTVADSSGNNNTGTLSGSPLPTWTTGTNGTPALSFDGSNYVDTGNPASLQITGSITLTAWINGSYWNPYDQDDVIIAKDGYERSFSLKGSQDCSGANQIDQLLLLIEDSSGSSFIQRCGQTILNNNTWYFVAGVYDAANREMHVYVNGNPDDANGYWTFGGLSLPPPSMYNSSNPVTIGSNNRGSQRFHGTIDDVKIYNRALSANEILAEYNNSNGLITSFDVLRDGVNIATLGPTATTFSDINGLLNLQGYNYTVTANGPGGSTSASKPVTTLDCTVPEKPIISGITPSCGNPGKALNFDGATNVNLGNPASLQITGDQTIEMWLYPTDFSQRRNPYAKAYGGEGTITIETDGTVSYFYGTCGGNCGTYQWFLMTNPLTPNAWNHLVLVRDLNAMTLKWYKNGALANQTGAAYSSVVSGNSATIGSGYTYNFQGKIDEVRIYNRALSAGEVTSHFNGGAGSYGGPETGLVAGYHFDENSGTNALDYSGNGNNGTISGGATWSDSPVAIAPGGGMGPVPQEQINWNTTSNTASYDIFRGGVNVGNVLYDAAKSVYQFIDSYSFTNQILSGSSYTYKVTAKNSFGLTNESVPVTSAQIPQCSPTTPYWTNGSPATSCFNGKSAADLYWQYQQPAQNISSFLVRRDDGTGFITVATIPEGGACATATCSKFFKDNNAGTGLDVNKNYTYQITATGPTGLSAISSTASMTAGSCSISTVSKISQCTLPGANPITHFVWKPVPSSDSYSNLSKNITPSYQYVYNPNSSSPSIIREWLIVGPFPNTGDVNFNTDYIAIDGRSGANETKINPRVGDTINGMAWKRYIVDQTSDFVDFNSAAAFGYTENILAYAFAYVYNTNATAVSGQLRVGSDDGVKAYVNGNKVIDHHIHRGASPDQEIVNITLNPGINTILIKVDQGTGGWGFYARLTDTAGNPLLDTITTSDSGDIKGEISDYFIWSPNAGSSNIVTETAPTCALEKPVVTIAPACGGLGAVANLSWNSIGVASYYQIWRGTTLANIAPMTVASAGVNAIVPAPQTSYSDTLIESNKNYLYAVEAVSDSGGSAVSDAVSMTSLSCNTVPEKPQLLPTDVKAVCAGVTPRVTLNWPDTVNAISYNVIRNGITLNPSVTVSAFTDASVFGGAQYDYQVQAVGSGGSSISNPPVTVTALNCSGPPNPPVLNPPIAFPQSLSILLTWQDTSINEDGFKVNRTFIGSGNLVKTSPEKFLAEVLGPFKELAFVLNIIADNLAVNAASYIDSTPGIQEDATYEYLVAAFNQADTIWSSPERVYMPISPPQNFSLNISCDSTSRKVYMDWSPGAGTTQKGGPVTYNALWSSSQSGTYSVLPPPCSADIPATNCTTDAPAFGKLWFKVQAKNLGGTTDSSSSKSCIILKYKEI